MSARTLNYDQVRGEPSSCSVTTTDRLFLHSPRYQEVKLWSTNADREKYENLATLYGIIVSLDHLERAYVRDTIRSEA